MLSAPIDEKATGASRRTSMRSGLFLALPFAAHGVVIDALMGLAMIAVGILLTRLNRLLKKAQADQMTQLWNER